jgi:hypothetical protein
MAQAVADEPLLTDFVEKLGLPGAVARDSLFLLICRRSGDDGDSDISPSVFL